jgi:very-short-patch-repair endonuclease
MRVTSNTVKHARQLRKRMSLPEVMLWKALRGREEGKPVFRRQHPIGPYVLDFFCARAQLCVEIDGGGHGFGDRPQADARRDGYLRSLGIRTIRWSAAEVMSDVQGAALAMLRVARDRSAPSTASRSPSPV